VAKTKPKHKVYLVENHPVTRDGFAELINYQQDLVCCGSAGTAAKALADIDVVEPDLVILDMFLPDGHGIELIKDLIVRRPNQRILVLAMHDERLFAERALRAGAKGYVMKQEPTEVVMSAIRKVLLGEAYLSPELQHQILGQFAGEKTNGSRSTIEELTDREIEVFELIGRGLRTHEISSRLRLSPSTVETYRGRLKEKLELSGAAKLTHRAVEWVSCQKG